MTDDATGSGLAPAREALAGLRPQGFGNGGPTKILDPLVEPLWIGLRILAAVDEAGVTMTDSEEGPITEMDLVVDGLAAAVPSASVIVDGFITKQATRAASATTPWPDEMPSMGSLIGLRSNRAVDTMKLKESKLASTTFDPDDEIALVVTDLLWLDGASLLDIPLLERRRLLEAVLVESDVVRLGAFVRPPIDAWVGSWRTQGFTGLTYKAANSRYLPGLPNPDWTIAGMPRR